MGESPWRVCVRAGDCGGVRTRGAGFVGGQEPRVHPMADLWRRLRRGHLHQRQWGRRRLSAPSLHAAADAAADRRMEAVNASRHAILLRRAGGDPRADRLETAVLALGALAFARGTARPRTVAGAAPG